MAVTLKALRRGTHRSATHTQAGATSGPGDGHNARRKRDRVGLSRYSDGDGVSAKSRSVAVSQGKGIHQAVDGWLSMKLKLG